MAPQGEINRQNQSDSSKNRDASMTRRHRLSGDWGPRNRECRVRTRESPAQGSRLVQKMIKVVAGAGAYNKVRAFG